MDLPGPDNTHEIAQCTAPDCHVVYADSDPLVLSHARGTADVRAPGRTGHIGVDLNDPAALIGAARSLLDFTQPVAILLTNVLGHIGDPGHGDDQAARSVVNQLKTDLPRGGYLAICDGTSTDPDYGAAIRHYNQTGAAPCYLRSPEQISRLLDGLELVPPGLLPVHQSRPDHSPFPSVPVPAWGAVARK